MTTGPAPELAPQDAAAVLQLPHDELTTEIARHLEADSEYRVSFVPSDPQRLVDLRWAALAAGRVLDRPVSVLVSRAAIALGNSTITVRVTFAHARRTVPAQRDQKS